MPDNHVLQAGEDLHGGGKVARLVAVFPDQQELGHHGRLRLHATAPGMAVRTTITLKECTKA